MGNKFYLKNDWRMQSAFLATDDPSRISETGYDIGSWHRTTVPSTVLNALVKNGVYPDPRVGLNNFLIPDSSDEYNTQNNLSQYSHLPGQRNPWQDPYWYRTEFSIPPGFKKSRLFLTFNAINYRAELWLNGSKIAGPREIVGAFLRFRFDITNLVKTDGPNCLTVKVHGPDHPGKATTQLNVFQPCRRADCNRIDDIHRDVTLTDFALGYDNVPEVRDRLMGILQDVYIEESGPVAIRDPFVKTKLPLPSVDKADITVSFELENNSDSVQNTTCCGMLEGKILFRKKVNLKPGETKIIEISPEKYPKLIIAQPRLWWPAGYGDQHIYKMDISVKTDRSLSDHKTVSFGVREVTKVLHEADGDYGLQIHINGQKIFSRGGYLVLPDTLMDNEVLNENRYRAEMEYLVHANLNTIVLQEPANMPDFFFDLCDQFGLMYWQCFYQCSWLRRYDFPLDHKLLERSGIDILKRYRNHPSIVAYMCMNEGRTERDQYLTWRKTVTELDGTRILIPSGYDNWADHREWAEWILPDTPVGVNDAKPKSYTWQPEAWYFKMVRDDRSWMFKIESGSASLPDIESIKKIIPDWDRPLAKAPYPLNSNWAYHGANNYFQNYDRAVRRLYGEPESLEDYCLKAHLVTANQHRAMFEAAHHRKWDITSGFLQWKMNSAWPDVQWQLYDYYLRPTPSLYYIKNACEPLHIQMNPLDSTVTVINHFREARNDLTAKATVYDLNMNIKYKHEELANIEKDCYKNIFTIPEQKDFGQVYFIKLQLVNKNKRIVSDNFYWLSPKLANCADDKTTAQNFDPFAEHHLNDDGAFLPLKNLPEVKLDHSCKIKESGRNLIAEVDISNPSHSLAFFIRVSAVNPENGEEFLPVLWNDNYFSLLPGERKKLSAVISKSVVGNTAPDIRIKGWNICDTLNYNRKKSKNAR